MKTRLKPFSLATKTTLKMKFSLALMVLLFAQCFELNTWAKVYHSDTPVGTCAGVNKESDGPGPISEERKKLEIECEPFDNKKEECEKKKDCRWVPEPQICEAILEGKSEEDANFCDAISDKEKCLKNADRCLWGYKAPVCNANDQTNVKDVEFCEKFDGTSEDQCERNSKCTWD